MRNSARESNPRPRQRHHIPGHTAPSPGHIDVTQRRPLDSAFAQEVLRCSHRLVVNFLLDPHKPAPFHSGGGAISPSDLLWRQWWTMSDLANQQIVEVDISNSARLFIITTAVLEKLESAPLGGFYRIFDAALRRAKGSDGQYAPFVGIIVPRRVAHLERCPFTFLPALPDDLDEISDSTVRDAFDWLADVGALPQLGRTEACEAVGAVMLYEPLLEAEGGDQGGEQGQGQGQGQGYGGGAAGAKERRHMFRVLSLMRQSQPPVRFFAFRCIEDVLELARDPSGSEVYPMGGTVVVDPELLGSNPEVLDRLTTLIKPFVIREHWPTWVVKIHPQCVAVLQGKGQGIGQGKGQSRPAAQEAARKAIAAKTAAFVCPRERKALEDGGVGGGGGGSGDGSGGGSGGGSGIGGRTAGVDSQGGSGGGLPPSLRTTLQAASVLSQFHMTRRRHTMVASSHEGQEAHAMARDLGVTLVNPLHDTFKLPDYKIWKVHTRGEWPKDQLGRSEQFSFEELHIRPDTWTSDRGAAGYSGGDMGNATWGGDRGGNGGRGGDGWGGGGGDGGGGAQGRGEWGGRVVNSPTAEAALVRGLD